MGKRYVLRRGSVPVGNVHASVPEIRPDSCGSGNSGPVLPHLQRLHEAARTETHHLFPIFRRGEQTSNDSGQAPRRRIYLRKGDVRANAGRKEKLCEKDELMPRLNSQDVIGQIVQSLGDTAKLDREFEPQIATGMALATVTMTDGTMFNIQVRKILQEADKTTSAEDRPEKFRDAYNRVQTRVKKPRAEKPPASPEESEQTG